MIVNVFHNITRDPDGRLAIFARYGEPRISAYSGLPNLSGRIRPGDELQLVGVLNFPTATNATQAAGLAFEAGNSPSDSEAVKEYRSWRVRSLSVGDVVVVEDDSHTVTTLGCESGGWTPVDLAQVKLVDAVTVSLSIQNSYELHDDVETSVAGVVIPAPPTNVESEEYRDWAYDNVYRYTGTGHTDGDSWYDVAITASSDHALVGRTFEWGY